MFNGRWWKLLNFFARGISESFCLLIPPSTKRILTRSVILIVKDYNGCFHNLKDWQLAIPTKFNVFTFNSDRSLLSSFNTTLTTPHFFIYIPAEWNSAFQAPLLPIPSYLLIFHTICTFISFSPLLVSLDATISYTCQLSSPSKWLLVPHFQPSALKPHSCVPTRHLHPKAKKALQIHCSRQCVQNHIQLPLQTCCFS